LFVKWLGLGSYRILDFDVSGFLGRAVVFDN